MKITSDIYLVGGSEESHPSDAAVYLITNRGEGALVDSGTGAGHDQLMDNIRDTGFDPGKIKYLFLTHCHYDHTGGAGQLRKITKCRIVAHELDATYIEEGNSVVTAASWYGSVMPGIAVDIKVNGFESDYKVGDLEIKLYHTPGHSPGSSVLAVRSDGQLVLFGQDIHGPLNDTLLSDRKSYVKSLEFMLSLEADILCEGHFGVFAGKDSVRNFIESYL